MTHSHKTKYLKLELEDARFSLDIGTSGCVSLPVEANAAYINLWRKGKDECKVAPMVIKSLSVDNGTVTFETRHFNCLKRGYYLAHLIVDCEKCDEICIEVGNKCRIVGSNTIQKQQSNDLQPGISPTCDGDVDLIDNNKSPTREYDDCGNVINPPCPVTYPLTTKNNCDLGCAPEITDCDGTKRTPGFRELQRGLKDERNKTSW